MSEKVEFRRFEVPPEAFAELLAIASFSDRLKEIQDAANAVGVDQDSRSTAENVAGRVDIKPDQVSLVLRGLLSLRSLKRASRLSSTGLFDSLTSSLDQAPSDWKNANLETWKRARNSVVQVLEQSQQDDPLSVRSKTRELTYLHENIFTGCRLLTELRPVFSKSADKILNTVLTTSLLVQYRADNLGREIQFAMDVNDLTDLREQCERAIIKISTAEKTFRETNLSLAVAGRQKLEENQ